jgi:multidrug resistance efflux pump
MVKKKKSGERESHMKEVFNEVMTVLHESAETPPAEDIDYDKALEELEHSLAELKKQADEVYSSVGLTREEVEEYTHNPDNFSKEEWAMFEEVRGELGIMQSKAEEALKVSPEDREAAQKKARRQGRRKKWMKT